MFELLSLSHYSGGVGFQSADEKAASAMVDFTTPTVPLRNTKFPGRFPTSGHLEMPLTGERSSVGVNLCEHH